MKRTHVALGVAALGLVALGGCATGSPAGGRSEFSTFRYRPLSPPSAPRVVPPPPPPKVSKPSPPSPPVVLAPSPAPTPGGPSGDQVVKIAQKLVGQRKVELGGRGWPSDCTGFVEGVYSQVGLELSGIAGAGDNGVTSLYRFAQFHGKVFDGGRPLPGDLVFFRETYDQNRDGRHNDGLTHVGIVEGVEPTEGTVTVIHRVQRGVVRYRMNLSHPSLAKNPKTGARLNDVLRSPGPGKPLILAGQLFAAYATLLPQASADALTRR